MARPVEFNKRYVLESAMNQFWREGYTSSTIDKLVDATGINRGSIYNSFGDKEEFFKTCVAAYNKNLQSILDETLLNDDLDHWQAIEDYFYTTIFNVSTRQRRLGCLIVNSICGSVNWDRRIQSVLRDSMNVVRTGFLRRCKALQKAGSLCAGFNAHLAADILMNTYLGLRVNARNGDDTAQLEKVVKITLTSLKR